MVFYQRQITTDDDVNDNDNDVNDNDVNDNQQQQQRNSPDN